MARSGRVGSVRYRHGAERLLARCFARTLVQRSLKTTRNLRARGHYVTGPKTQLDQNRDAACESLAANLNSHAKVNSEIGRDHVLRGGTV